jgi:hypothetical protein
MVAEAEGAVGLGPVEPVPPASTWLARRRSSLISTPRPITTLVAGILAPPVLFAMSLRIEADFAFSPGDRLVPLQPYSTLLMAASVAILLLWLATRRREGWSHALLAGPLFLAAFVALAIGVLMFPLSLTGVLVGGVGFLESHEFWAAVSGGGIGVLGFIPFWTSLAYLRAALLANASARKHLRTGPRVALLALAAFAVGTTVVGSGRIARLVAEHEIRVLLGELDGDLERAEAVLSVLYVFPQISVRSLSDGAIHEWDESMQPGPIALAFERITGSPAVQAD